MSQGTWDEQREAFGDTVIDTISQYAPNLKNLIIGKQVITPLDIERQTGLSEGNIFQGELSLEQLFFLRPAAGWARYRTPIKKLYTRRLGYASRWRHHGRTGASRGAGNPERYGEKLKVAAHRSVVILGGGHNALVAAFYLAKKGHRPLVLERRNMVGGAAVTEEFHPGFKCSTVAHAGGPPLRLAAIEKLKRKYGAKLEDVLAFLETVKADLAAVETSSQRREALEKELAQLSAAYESAAGKLSSLRQEAARELGKRVEKELESLAMEKTRVEIRVQPAPWSARGADAVEFLLAPNVGEELKPLEKIASGGELSRVALALKTCTGSRGSFSRAPVTLVFDEVDAGVGGSAAEAVGRRLKKLSHSSQVICVTHLPQIAGFADHHYFVSKAAARGAPSRPLRN